MGYMSEEKAPEESPKREYKYKSEFKKAIKRYRDLYVKHRDTNLVLKKEIVNLQKKITRTEQECEFAWDIVRRYNNYGLDAKGKIRDNGEVGATCGPVGRSGE